MRHVTQHIHEVMQLARDRRGLGAALILRTAVGPGGGPYSPEPFVKVFPTNKQIKAKEIKYHVLAQYVILICKALICGAVTSAK